MKAITSGVQRKSWHGRLHPGHRRDNGTTGIQDIQL